MQKINRRLTSKVAAHIGTQHIETIDFLDHEAERAVAIIDDVADELAALMKHHPVLIQHHVSLVLETLPKRVGKSLYDSLLKCGERSAEGVAIALVRGLPPAYLPMDITTQESVAGGILKAIIGTAAVAKQAVKFVAGKEPVVTKQSFKKKLLSLILEPIKKAVLEKIVLGGAKAIAWLMRHVRTSISPQRIARIIIDGISKGYDRVMIARELRNELGATKAQAKRIARTEGARVATESNMAAFEELGEMVLGYLIHSVLDERTRPQHRARNGTIYYKEPTGNQLGLKDMPRPPVEADGSISFNCRCWISPLFEQLDDLHVPANAEGSLIPNVLVYQDWFKRATERQRRIAVGARRYDLITSKHGKDVSYYYYIQDNGDLIPLETAKRESPKDTQDRVHAVRLMAQANRRNRRDVLAMGQA